LACGASLLVVVSFFPLRLRRKMPPLPFPPFSSVCLLETYRLVTFSIGVLNSSLLLRPYFFCRVFSSPIAPAPPSPFHLFDVLSLRPVQSFCFTSLLFSLPSANPPPPSDISDPLGEEYFKAEVPMIIVPLFRYFSTSFSMLCSFRISFSSFPLLPFLCVF